MLSYKVHIAVLPLLKLEGCGLKSALFPALLFMISTLFNFFHHVHVQL